MSTTRLDEPAVVAAIVNGYIQGPDFEQLKEEIRAHEFGNFYWEVVKGRRETPTSQEHYNCKKILFVNETSVIVQDVELSYDATRFETFKIYLEDWGKCFATWDLTTRSESHEQMKVTCARIWKNGFTQYN